MRRVGVGEGLPRHRREMELSSSFRPQPGAPWRGLWVLGARLRTVRRQTWPAFLKTADERKPCARRGAGPVPASGCGTEGGPCAGRGLARLRDRRGTVCRAGPGWASGRCGSGGRRGSDLWPPRAGGGATSSTVTRGQHGRQRAWGPWHFRTVLSVDRAAAHKTIGHVTVFLGCRVVRGRW